MVRCLVIKTLGEGDDACKTFFSETGAGKRIPCAVLIDLLSVCLIIWLGY